MLIELYIFLYKHINNSHVLYSTNSFILFNILQKMLIVISGPLSKDIVVYYTISAIVLVFVICVCFVVYQCRTVSKRKKTTVTTSKTHVRRHISQNVTREERVYNIIVDEDMLDDEDIQKIQIEMSSDFSTQKSRMNVTKSN